MISIVKWHPGTATQLMPPRMNSIEHKYMTFIKMAGRCNGTSGQGIHYTTVWQRYGVHIRSVYASPPRKLKGLCIDLIVHRYGSVVSAL